MEREIKENRKGRMHGESKTEGIKRKSKEEGKKEK
jgi:hypothetical protein